MVGGFGMVRGFRMVRGFGMIRGLRMVEDCEMVRALRGRATDRISRSGAIRTMRVINEITLLHIYIGATLELKAGA